MKVEFFLLFALQSSLGFLACELYGRLFLLQHVENVQLGIEMLFNGEFIRCTEAFI